jgi:hypothetical protein
MATPANAAVTPPPGYTLDTAAPVAQAAPAAPAGITAPAGYTIDADSPGLPKAPPPAAPAVSPEQQAAYREATRSGPFVPAGAAEKVMGMGQSNKDQAIEAAKLTGQAALETAGGIAGASIPAALPAVLPHTIEGVKALGAWAKENPMQAYILFQVAKEFIPGVKKALGIVHDAPTP